MKLFKLSVKIILISSLGAVIAFAPQVLFADDDLFCPAVYPCDDFGELLPMFEGHLDACALKFALQCKSVRADARKGCSAVSEQYNSLLDRTEAQQARLIRLRKMVKKLKQTR